MTNCVLPGRVAPEGRRRPVSALWTRALPPFLVMCLCWIVALTARAATTTGDIRRDAAVQAVEKVLPSIVNISTETVMEGRDPLDELFRDFFGPYYRRRPPDAQKSLGSGVIIDELGYILTNFHVVQRASRITVTLVDGREFQAKALSQTAKSDVALLKLVTHGDEKFEAIRFAGDDDVLLAETVLALGNPFGLGVSVSRGIVSSKARRPAVENEPLEVEDWLQTDAAINPGNSGGPLVNMRGELVGLNVAMFREGHGIGFAIPVKRLSEAVAEIFTPEELKGLWFGAHFKMGTSGVVTTSVETGSPAESAGMRTGDLISQVNEKVPRSLVELSRETVPPGEKREVRFQTQRRGERREVVVHLVPEREVFNAALLRQRLGVSAQELTPQQAVQMGLENGDGLLITAVDKGSPAAHANLTRGCIIQAVEGRPAESITAVAKRLHARAAGDRVEMNVLVSRVRGGFVEIYPAKVAVSLR
jgi:S1-C subfamily serine protease